MESAERSSRLLWLLVIANLIAVGAVIWLSWPAPNAPAAPLRVTPLSFTDLPGWSASDPRDALSALRRSCATLKVLPPAQAMGGAGYGGRVAQWLAACAAAPARTTQAGQARAFFEAWFTPLAIGAGSVTRGLFTGYYEPELTGSVTRTTRFDVPIYGLPGDLVTVDLGQFRVAFAGEQIVGRLDKNHLVPYPTRAEIDQGGLPLARVLLYTDDPVTAFFLQIQGSGRVRFADGSVVRLAYAGKNGRPYTPIGRVLVARGALALHQVSLQTIAAWLRAHPQDAKGVMEADQSYVFFSTAPLGDAALGSPGTEGVALAPAASLAVDVRLHPLAMPFYLVTTVPDADPAKPDRDFAKLLVAQDSGGAIRGPVRGDVFWGFGAGPEAIAGRMKSRGRFFALVPKPVAATLAPYKDFPDVSL